MVGRRGSLIVTVLKGAVTAGKVVNGLRKGEMPARAPRGKCQAFPNATKSHYGKRCGRTVKRGTNDTCGAPLCENWVLAGNED